MQLIKHKMLYFRMDFIKRSQERKQTEADSKQSWYSLSWLKFRSWRWRQYLPQKCLLIFTELHGVTSQKPTLWELQKQHKNVLFCRKWRSNNKGQQLMDLWNATTVIISIIVNKTKVDLLLCQEINDLLHIGFRSVTLAFQSGQKCKKNTDFPRVVQFSALLNSRRYSINLHVTGGSPVPHNLLQVS
jgi:hypothetical protein